MSHDAHKGSAPLDQWYPRLTTRQEMLLEFLEAGIMTKEEAVRAAQLTRLPSVDDPVSDAEFKKMEKAREAISMTGLGEDIDENDANWFFQLSPSQRTDEDYEWYHAGNHYRKRCSPHEWVNISLMNEKLVCKKCDCDYDEKTHASRK